MTKREAVIIETFMTHMYANKEIVEKLKQLSKPDFIKICENLD